MKYRSGLAQVILIGFLAFCGPGLFNALNGLGGVGTGDNRVAAISNGTLYGFFSVVGYFAGFFFNLLGPRLCFTIGGCTYAFYAICNLYQDVSLALPALGGSVLGFGAGIFWCAQMALSLAYACPNEKGKFSGIFWVIFNLGGVFGGFIQMGLNWKLFNEEEGGIYSSQGTSASTIAYWVFIILMLIGSVSGFFLMVSPENVIKSDGSKVEVRKAITWQEELKAAAGSVLDPFVQRMIVYFIFSNWFYTYEFGFVNGMHFNSRAAGMNSGLYWAGQMLGAVILPFFVDRSKWSIKKRAMSGFYVNLAMLLISWVMAIAAQFVVCNGKVDKAKFENPIFTVGSTDGVEVQRNVLPWFPESACNSLEEADRANCKTGCDFLDMCEAAGKCPKNSPLCFKGADDRGTCRMDIKTGEDFLCGLTKVDGKYECMQVDFNFGSEISLMISTYILMGISDAMFQVYALWLMGNMAGSSLDKTVTYAAAYKGIQSAGACVAWLTDMIAGFTYHIQAYVNIIIAVIAMSGSLLAIPLVVRSVEERADRASSMSASSKTSDYSSSTSTSSSSDSSSTSSDEKA